MHVNSLAQRQAWVPCSALPCPACAAHWAPHDLPQPPNPPALQTKHVKPGMQGETGQIVKKEFPVHHSNVAVYSTAQQVHSRVGYK